MPRFPSPCVLAPALALLGCATAAPVQRPAAPPAPIVQTGAPVLRSRASEVPAERIATPEFQELVRTMIETMRAAPGVGLAAPQIGVPWRVIVLEDRAELLGRLTEQEREERERVAFPVTVLVNPVLRSIGDARATFFEGCLSVSGFVGLVDRAREVEVEALDERGVPRTWRVRGWPARILQHEVDHLDGTLYVDRMMTRSFSTAEHAKVRFGAKPIAEIRRELGL
jgi:peptide deformylase